MDDYISRKAVVEIALTYHEAHDITLVPGPYKDGFGCGANLREQDITNGLMTLPAADVRPVKEGHWVKARGSWCSPGGDPVWECSECGKGVHVYGVEHGTYGSDIADGQWVSCPNCGAKMGRTP